MSPSLPPEDIQNTLAALENILLDKDSPPSAGPGPAPAASAKSPDLLAQAGSVVMIDGVANDLRSPLYAIILYVEHLLIGQGGHLNDEQARILSVVTENTKRLANFINNLLDLNRVSQGQMSVTLVPQQLGPIIDDVAEIYRVVAEKKRVRLLKEVPADLPAVSAQREKIEQVLINLLSNALKFTPAGGSVTVSAAVRDGRWVQASVRDTGPGIAESLLPELLKPYAQLDAERRLRLVKGTGLGLLISKEIVDAHGGQIWTESEPGKGAAVHFALPLAP